MVQLLDRLSKFLGVSYVDETDSNCINHRNAWLERRRRLLKRRCGRLKDEQLFMNTRSNDTQLCDLTQKYQYTNENLITVDSNKTMTYNDVESPKTTETILNISTHLSPDDIDKGKSMKELATTILQRQPKRVFGMGFVGNLLKRKFKKELKQDQFNELLSFNDHRPYFTYWVTTTQILITIISIFTYGIGPIGFDRTLVKDKILLPTLNYHQESYYERDNIWIGPRAADLIRLGAKFTPCMRRDVLIYKQIDDDREEEKLTGCCIRTDQSGCLQTSKQACSSTSKWLSWNETIDDEPSGSSRHRISGPVCGQDPKYCSQPDSIGAHEWPDDISKWPICTNSTKVFKPFHQMSCELLGRPCCIGIHGQCRITTSQHCQFLRGTFHPEATLCSQVSCMEDVCGMIPFYADEYPDQFYRLAIALFTHAGLIHLSITVVLQFYVMRDIERLLGSKRMALVYMISGMVGYLASATFVPYHTQVGPSGSQFALLACLMAETINSWSYLENPANSMIKFIGLALCLFIVGLLPWIDNYAHIFGFITGLALALALTPYLTPLNEYNRKLKIVQIISCFAITILLIVLLTSTLYIFPLYKCSWCKYLDCLPIFPNWCEDQDIKVKKLDVF